MNMIKLFYTSVRVVIRRHHPSVCARLQPVRHYSVKHLQPAQVSFVRQHLSASLFFFLSSSLGQMRARGMGRSRWRWARRWPLLLPVAFWEFGPHPQDRSIHSLFLFCFSRRSTRASSSATAAHDQTEAWTNQIKFTSVRVVIRPHHPSVWARLQPVTIKETLEEARADRQFPKILRYGTERQLPHQLKMVKIVQHRNKW